MINAGQTISVEPSKSANQRTRNRIREHGPIFKVVTPPRSLACFQNAIGVLLDAPDGWRGSLQVRHLKITLVKG